METVGEKGEKKGQGGKGGKKSILTKYLLFLGTISSWLFVVVCSSGKRDGVVAVIVVMTIL